MEHFSIKAEIRTTTGKNENNRLRMSGNVPAIIYGKTTESFSASLNERDIVYAVKHGSRIFNLELSNGVKKVCVLKEVQLDPVKDKFLHIDFLAVEPKEVFKITVPVKLLNSEKAHGVRMGGQLVQLIHKLDIKTTVESLPASLDFDITALSNSQSLLVRNIELPNIKILKIGSAAICNISKSRK